MSKSTPKVSEIFPEEYGDFALQSSDKVVCYFPRHILSHVSPVFRDMFNINKDQQNTKSQPVQLTESSITVEHFLTHLNPNALTPHIDPDTIEGLMMMAHKYQTNVIIRWFEQEILMRRATKGMKMQYPFLSTHPALTLSLAYRLDLKKTRDLAVSEMLGCSSYLVTDGIIILPNTAYLAITQHRNLRIQRYEKWIDELASNYEDYGTNPKSCRNCSSKRAKWILQMSRSVQSSPSWPSFSKAYSNNGKCCVSWEILYDTRMSTWAAAAQVEEAKLPTDIF